MIPAVFLTNGRQENAHDMSGPSTGLAVELRTESPSGKSRLEERIEQTRSICLQALAEPVLAAVESFLAQEKVTATNCRKLLKDGAKQQRATAELLALQTRFSKERVLSPQSGTFERALLLRAAVNALAYVQTLPVDESVKFLFCREFSQYANPPESSRGNFDLSVYPFYAMSKIVLLQRFPAGQHQWEVSGFPRRWLSKVQLRFLPQILRFLWNSGSKPFIHSHFVATTRKRYVLLEREYRKSFYRMVAALEMQPSIRGLMDSSWLHSKETHRVSPHLAFLSRPYLEAGGIYADLGPAHPNDGFLIGSAARAELYRTGKYKPTVGVVMCSREQALAWKQAHAEIEATLSVK